MRCGCEVSNLWNVCTQGAIGTRIVLILFQISKLILTFIGPESDQYLALLLRLDWCDLADDYACSILAVNFIDVVAHDIVDCLSQLICTHLDSHLLCSITKLKDHSHLEA